MIRTRLAAALALAAGLTAAGIVLASAPPASATEGDKDLTPSFETCKNLKDWFVNPDETDRRPDPTVAGLKFGPADLIHHATWTPLAHLKPGSFTAFPAPDQPSFFSVEVRNTPGTAYGTLRWTGSAWSITIGAGIGPDGPATDGTFTGTDPVALVADKVTKWGKFNGYRTRAVSFGVGYTKTPPGTVNTIVSSVTFNGKKYRLTCPLPTTSPSPSASVSTSASASPSASVSTSASASPSASVSTSASASPSPSVSTSATVTPTATRTSTTPVATVPAGNSGGLPKTGPSIGLAAGFAVAILGTGAALVLATRRRKLDFES